MAVSGKRVAVVGAGIVGVCTAMEVQNRCPNFDVTLIADKFNDETLSASAGGLFMPGTYIFGPDLEISRQWICDSYSFYKNLLDTKKSEGWGINEIPCHIFSSKDSSSVKNHYLESCLPDFRVAAYEELKPFISENNVIKHGSFFTSLVIECHFFLSLALKKINDNGGTTIRKTLESLEELYEDYDIVFNCTGLGEGKLCNDLNVLPIRGQVIQVKAPWIDRFYFCGHDTYIIPWKERGMVVLGGCRHFGSYDDQTNERVTEEIIEKCTALVPSLKEPLKTDYDVWVGLRPYRDRVRVETETVRNTLVVHNYGHGGYGITLAPGTVKYALDLASPHLAL